MATVRARVKELIPTAKFANVEIGLEIEAEHTEYDEDDPEVALEKAYDMADRVLQKKRDEVIADLEDGND